MSLSTRYPNINPTLLLDFANVKALDPRITFTRASTASFYDGKTVAKAEENLFLRSEEFDNASWTKQAVTVTANTATAPDGTSTADSVFETATTGAHILNQIYSFVAGQNYATSLFVKPDTRTKIVFRAAIVDSVFRNVGFDLTGSGSVTFTGSGYTGSIVASTNGFFRISVLFTATSTANFTVNWLLAETDPTNNSEPSYAGDITKGLYVWGAQLEQRSSVTAYTATTDQPITNYIPALQTAASGVARFEHNPITGESLGLEIEEQRTNLVTRSEEFDNNSIWTKTNGSITANTIVAPNGTLTGDLFIPNASSGRHTVAAGATVVTATSHTMTVYAKAGIYSKLLLREDAATGSHASFDLSTGTVLVAASATASIVSAGNGWYRCSATITSSGTFFLMGISVLKPAYVSGNNVLESWSGNGFDGIYIWGAQLEAGAFATSYIPTVASQVTRSADAASMTGANFSSWFRADEGTVYSESTGANSNSNPRYTYAIYDGTANNFIANFFGTSGTQECSITRFGTAQAALPTSTANNGKVAFAFKTNDSAASLNAGTVATDTDCILPVVNQFAIGGRLDSSTRYLNGTIKKLAFYPKRLTNAELQGMTTV